MGMTIALLHFGAKEIHARIHELFDFKEILIVGLEILTVGVLTHILSRFLSEYAISYVVRTHPLLWSVHGRSCGAKLQESA